MSVANTSTALLLKATYKDPQQGVAMELGEANLRATFEALGVTIEKENIEFAGDINARIQKAWDENKLIQFLVILGHGNGDSVQVSDSNYFTANDVDVELWQKAIPQNGEIILFSCHSGRRDGIAQKVSEKVQNVNVIGSRIVAFATKILNTKEGFKFYHEIRGIRHDVTSSYYNGQNVFEDDAFTDAIFQHAYEKSDRQDGFVLTRNGLEGLIFLAQQRKKHNSVDYHPQPTEQESPLAPPEFPDSNSNEDGYSSGEELRASPALQRKEREFDFTPPASESDEEEYSSGEEFGMKEARLQRENASFDLSAPKSEKPKKVGIFKKLFSKKKAKA